MIDLNPFVKLCWNSSKLAKQWSEKYPKIQNLTQRTEYEMVKRGLRKANVFHVSPQNFDKQLEMVTRDDLVYLPMVRSKSYNGFSHKHFPVDQLDLNCFVYGVVAKNIETAQQFVDASKRGDHIEQGLLLGYPKCCAERFNVNWTDHGILDPCFEAAEATSNCLTEGSTAYVNASPYINPLLRYFGFKIAPFFPCSLQCEEAVKVGKTWFDLMCELDSETAHEVKTVLEQPSTWSLNKSIIYITTPLFKGIVNGYPCENRKEVVANDDSKLELVNDIEKALAGVN